MTTAETTIPEWAFRLPPLDLDRRYESEAEWQRHHEQREALRKDHEQWWEEMTPDRAALVIQHAISAHNLEEKMFEALRNETTRSLLRAACLAEAERLVGLCIPQPMPKKCESHYPATSLSPRTVSLIERVWWPHSAKTASRLTWLGRLPHRYSSADYAFLHRDRVERSMTTLHRFYGRRHDDGGNELRLLKALLLHESFAEHGPLRPTQYPNSKVQLTNG